MADKVLLGTFNQAKIAEYAEILQDYRIPFLTLADLKITDQVEEPYSDYEQNAKAKALFYFNLANIPTLGDDGGFEIDYLNGEPGVKSRRWLASLEQGRSGLDKESSDEELISHLKKVINNLPASRNAASFVDVLCLVKNPEEIYYAKSQIDGFLVPDHRDDFPPGFPYRSFFKDKKFGKHLMDLSAAEYRQISHRRKNVEALLKYF